MDYKRIQIDSIAIGVKDVYDLDLSKDNFINTYLTVGHLPDIALNLTSMDYRHNLIITEKAVGVNTTRQIINSKSNDSFIVQGNIHCMGTIYANDINLNETISTTLPKTIQDFKQILNRLSSHLLFYNTKDYTDNNIYTTHNVIIGNDNNADNNTNAFKISRYCNNIASNIQFVIENNDITNDTYKSAVSIGIIGNSNISPTHIITSKNMPLHFNISKNINEINNYYYDNINNDFRKLPLYTEINPSMSLDINGSVAINTDISKEISYNKYSLNIFQIIVNKITEYPKLYVNGSLYSKNIIIYDYISETPKNIDDIYIRQGNIGGLTLFPNQIRGGNFNKDEFTFNSNVYIGTNENNYKLKIYGNAEISNNLDINNINTNIITINSNLIANRCEFNGSCYFKNNDVSFRQLNCLNNISSKNIYINDTFIYRGSNITFEGLKSNAILANKIEQLTFTNSINVGGKVDNISDINYNSELINIYKYRINQYNKFEICMNDTSSSAYGSVAYIGHCPLNNLLDVKDNSLVILTQYNSKWNNIYFYAGKNKNEIKSFVPNLAIMENNKIGINTNNPEKTLDINGDIITNKYYYRQGTKSYECKNPIIYNNYNNINNLNINIQENQTNIINPKKLNVIGGINSYNGYYENNYKLSSIKIIDNNSNAIIENTNVGFGININNSKITMPLQIINTNVNNNKINNSVITFYRSIDNSKYSGIEFCDDPTNINTVNMNKWYIYKNHITDDINFVGPLQIGYVKNDYIPRKSCINLYYDNNKYYIDINNPNTYNSADEFNKNKEDMRISGNVKITGDLDIDGSINIKGNYKFNDNNILFSPNPLEKTISRIYSLGNNVYYFDTILTPNHPKNISFLNSNIANNLNININDDKLNLNKDLNIQNSSNNSNNSYNNYLLTSNINNDIIIYSNNYILNSISSIQNIDSNNFQNVKNIRNTYLNNPSSITSNTLISLTSNNMNYAYSNYIFSSNIYISINNITQIPIISYISTANDYNNLSLQNKNTIINSYSTITYNADINVITKLSSNIYNDAINNYNYTINYNQFLNSINTAFFSYMNTTSNNMNSMSNIYIHSSNYYNTIKTNHFTLADYNNIITSNYIYADNYNNFIISNINDTTRFINKYNEVINNFDIQKSRLEITNNNNYSRYISSSRIYNILTIPSYIDASIVNSNIANDNISSNIRFITDYNNYTNVINDIYDKSNAYLDYKEIIISSNNFLNINNYNNYEIFSTVNLNITNTIGRENEIYNYTESNVKYTSNIYNITCNINNQFNNIKDTINIYNNLSIINSNIAYDNYINVSNIYETLNNNYKNLTNIIDINSIVKSGYSNNYIASNIYINVLNQKNKIDDINNLLTSNISYISTDKISISNIYNICSNYNLIKTTDNILNVLSSNNLYSYNITLATNNITSNILYNYSVLYDNIYNSSNIYDKNNINILTAKNKQITNKISTSITSNLSLYIEKSTSNLNNVSILDNIISSISYDYNEELNIYRNDEQLITGISNIKSYLDAELIIFNVFESNIKTLFSDYIIDDYFKDEYEKNLLSVNYCIELLLELIQDANDLVHLKGNNQIPASILLESSMDITNKYINFINNSYNFANSSSKLIEVINNNVDIYILSSLSILPLLNTMIDYANSHLREVWEVISQKIVLFASLSYSLNIIISSSPSLSQTANINNNEGKNTDVLIIGNNIKLYPNKSLIIGYENDYTRWLELINDDSKKSVAYFFNSEYNSCVSSFNCRAIKFKSASTQATSLKTTASIDINLIDTSINNFEESMFDGVSLKLSHIYHRSNIHNANATSNNSIFEIVNKKNLTNPYFSMYSYDNNNIFNIGKGTFYENNNCINSNTVVHINENTSKHLLTLSNPSSNNPLSISLNHNINNKWILEITDKFKFIYNNINIISIKNNNIIINNTENTEDTEDTSLCIYSYNKSALTLNNKYGDITLMRNMTRENMNITYNNNGIIYSKKTDIFTNDTYDFKKEIFEINTQITIENINYTLSDVPLSFNNINEVNLFRTDTSNNSNNIYLLPDIKSADSNIEYINTSIKTISKVITYSEQDLFTINYIVPKIIDSNNLIVTNIKEVEYSNHGYHYYYDTHMIFNGIPDEKYEYVTLTYDINNLKIQNKIKFYKYGSFDNEKLDVKIKNYVYKIIRNNNIVPKDIYKNPTNTIIASIENSNTIIINNTLNYLKDSTITKYPNTFTQNIKYQYPLSIFDKDYNIEINITVNDKYDTYFTANDNVTENIPLEYINNNAKLPMIKHKNIYNNYHNIYSYTDDYEIYFNSTKLINIDNKGTLTTIGNIHTNNIYLNGDIYNSQGISLYDNILSLINNISSTQNYELNSKNIILNPSVGFNDKERGGILINGNNINNINNNLFQINNNYINNDNFITLNSCSTKSFIHFNNKITGENNLSINSIYRVGTEDNKFGIWKYNTFQNYNDNLYIDTNNNNNCNKVFDITMSPDSTTNFILSLNGEIHTPSDSRLKTDIKRIENALDKIMTLNGITYSSVGNIEQKRQTGLIAQEVKEILPEVISINSDGYYNIAYANMTGLIIEAIKELKLEINELKSQII